jgi:hypothetical protein
MTILRFKDGVSFDTSGPLRITKRADGWYVVGQGFLCPCDTEDEAQKLLADLASTDHVH